MDMKLICLRGRCLARFEFCVAMISGTWVCGVYSRVVDMVCVS